MVLPVADLPDDIDALKAMIQEMAREHAEIAHGNAAQLDAAKAEIARLKTVEAAANERIANLTAIMNVLQRAQHGTRSERLRFAADDEQVAFAFEASHWEGATGPSPAASVAPTVPLSC